MPKQRGRPGQIGDQWLSKNRHGVWSRTWYDDATRQTRRSSLGTLDFDEAVMMLAKWVVRNSKIEQAAAAEMPLYTCLDRYHEHHAVPNTARRGEASAIAIAKIKKFFPPSTTVGDMTLERQYAFEVSLKDQGYADGYIGRIQGTLSAAIGRSYRAQEIATAPYIRILKGTKTRKRILTKLEAAALFNASRWDRLTMFLMLLFNTVSRPTALLELQPGQVDFEHRLIDLNPESRRQTKKRRPTVPITDTLLPWLQQRRGQDFFIQRPKGKKAKKRLRRALRGLRKTWAKMRTGAEALLKEANPQHPGLAGVTPYTIRHTVATELRRSGVPDWELAGLLGHRMPRAATTEIYAPYAPDYLGRAAAAIDSYMNELQPLVKRELILNVTPIGAGWKA